MRENILPVRIALRQVVLGLPVQDPFRQVGAGAARVRDAVAFFKKIGFYFTIFCGNIRLFYLPEPDGHP